MKMLELKGKGFIPLQTRDDLTDDLHAFLGLNTDTEIITYKKIKEIYDLTENKNQVRIFLNILKPLKPF